MVTAHAARGAHRSGRPVHLPELQLLRRAAPPPGRAACCLPARSVRRSSVQAPNRVGRHSWAMVQWGDESCTGARHRGIHSVPTAASSDMTNRRLRPCTAHTLAVGALGIRRKGTPAARGPRHAEALTQREHYWGTASAKATRSETTRTAPPGPNALPHKRAVCGMMPRRVPCRLITGAAAAPPRWRSHAREQTRCAAHRPCAAHVRADARKRSSCRVVLYGPRNE